MRYLTILAEWWQYNVFIAHFRVSAGGKRWINVFTLIIPVLTSFLFLIAAPFFPPFSFFPLSSYIKYINYTKKVMNKESKRSGLTTTVSSGRAPYYSCVLLLQHTDEWAAELTAVHFVNVLFKAWWESVSFKYTRVLASACTELHTATHTYTYMLWHTAAGQSDESERFP